VYTKIAHQWCNADWFKTTNMHNLFTKGWPIFSTKPARQSQFS